MASYHKDDIALLLTNQPPHRPGWFKKWGGFYQDEAILAVDEGLYPCSLIIVYVNDEVKFPKTVRMTSIAREVLFCDREELTAYLFGHELGHHVWKKRGYDGSFQEQQAWCDSFALTLIGQALRWNLQAEPIKPAAASSQLSLALHLA